MSRSQSSTGTDTISRDKEELKEPKLYKVLLINDDYTSMDFVVAVLESIFNKSPAEAVQIMLAVHNRGRGLCGIYPKEIAEAKIDLVHKRARQEGFPLQCAMSEA